MTLDNEAFTSSFLKLRMQNNYSSPLGGLNTRIGFNKYGKQVISRLDYCISNLNAFIDLRFHPGISDHCLFLIKSEIHLSRRRKLRLYKRKKIIESITMKSNWTINDSLAIIRSNLDSYTKVFKPKVYDSNFLDLKLPDDISESIKSWIDQYRILARDIIKMRFYMDQGKAFQLMKKITKYHNFMKRDGSIATVVKHGNMIEADEEKNS